MVVATFGITPGYSADLDVNRPIRDKWALVIGISEFANPKINLRYPAKDAKDFANYLINEAGFARDHVKVLVNQDATEKRILSELGNKWLPHVANPDDLVVLFISTHGSGAELDVGGQNYLLAYDTDVDDLYTSGIPMQKLARDIRERIHCDRVVIFLDACHSGATTTTGGAKGLFRSGVDAAEVAAGSGQLVITSSKDDQVSWESKTTTNSVFTEKLIAALRSKGGQATLGQIYDSLKDQVQDTVLRERGVLQTPLMKSEWKGNDLILASKPANPQPGLEETGTENQEKETRPPSQSVSKVHAPQEKVESTQIASTAVPTVQSISISESRQPANKLPPRPGSMVVPGKGVGRTRLGMTREEISGMLGRPTQTSGNVLVYRSQDRRNFLALRFKDDILNDIAFSSSAFSTENGINTKSFDGVIDKATDTKFATRRTLGNGMTIHERKGGGLFFVTSSETEVGIVTNVKSAKFDPSWLPGQAKAPLAKIAAPLVKTTEPLTDKGTAVQPASTAASTTAETGTWRGNPPGVLPITPPPSNPVKVGEIVPGKTMGSALLGMGKDAILTIFGSPTTGTNNVMTYVSAKRKTFLSLLLRDNKLAQVAFTSHSFSTADGISIGNFNEPVVRNKFLPPTKTVDGKYNVYTLREGGFSIAVSSDGKTVGCVHANTDVPSKAFWP
jgi:uncharacterized caspase-like protein